MANGKAFEEAINQCLEVRPPNIGVHLVLVDEKSLTGMQPTRNHRIFFIKYILGMIKLSEIEKELRAQLEKVVKTGIKLNFINSHQHLHLLSGITDIVIKLAKIYHIPQIRIVNQPISSAKGKFLRQAQLLFLNFLSKITVNKIKKAGLQCNDYFIGFINAGNLTLKDIKQAKELSEKYPDKIIELGCHPGYENDDLRARYGHWGDYNWHKELELFKNFKF